MVSDLAEFLTPLLQRLDRTSMGATVECRVPFLDHRMVHTALSMPLSYKLGARANKWVLREVAKRCLPMPLAKRKKMGFPLPLADYVRPLAKTTLFEDGFCETVLGMDPRGIERTVRDWERWVYAFFGMITLEIWGRLFVLGQSIEAVERHVLDVELQRTEAF
jgi:asparagine synthase (glutamine-hydrolysing)